MYNVTKLTNVEQRTVPSKEIVRYSSPLPDLSRIETVVSQEGLVNVLFGLQRRRTIY